jgi:hypothetical protein
MKLRLLAAVVMAVAMAMPAPTLAADQDVDVQVHPANTLGISVQEGLGFQMAVGDTQLQPFNMEVQNTTAGGWNVTVAGADFQSYFWLDCDEYGCYNRTLTDPVYTIDNANLTVTGGDVCWGCEDAATDPTITMHSVALDDSPTLLMEGTAEAWGQIGFGPPYEPTLQLTIPEGTMVGQSYWTTLTYTIMAP